MCLTLAAEQRLTAASREGCRVAALGGHPDEIETAVRRHLGPGLFQQAQVTALILNAHGRPVHSGEPVEVGVRIPAGDVVPDLLSFIGYSIRGETLSAFTVMRKE
jgi:hypothetical protein